MERTRAFFLIQFSKGLSRLPCPDQQNPPSLTCCTINADEYHAPGQSQDGGVKQEGAHTDTRQVRGVLPDDEYKRVGRDPYKSRDGDSTHCFTRTAGRVRLV